MERYYERFALILDTAAGGLGRTAMQLLDAGIDVLYANDLDEAELLVRQESDRLGAVLIPADTPPAQVESVLKRICPRLAADTESLVMTGLEPDPEICRELRDRGAKWCLWEPFDDRELRFVMTAAMATRDPADDRIELRIHTELEAHVLHETTEQTTVVDDISASGAYIATPQPPPAGSALRIEIAQPGHALALDAEVIYVRSAPSDPEAGTDGGMGVAFRNLDDERLRPLRSYIANRISPFLI